LYYIARKWSELILEFHCTGSELLRVNYPLQETTALPSAALGKGSSANFKSAKGSLPSAFYRALGKGFAECLLGGTRQRKVTVMTGYKLTVALPSVCKKGTRQRNFFKKILNFCAECPTRRHSAKKFGIFLKKFFAECPRTLGKEINFFYLKNSFFYLKNSLPSAQPRGTRQINSGFFLKKFFAKCPSQDTRQRN